MKISNNPKICRFLPTFFQLMLLLLKTCHSIFRPKSYYLIIKSFLQNFLNLKYIGYRWIKTQFPMHFLFGKVKMAIKISNSCIFRSKYILVLLQESYLKKIKIGSWKWSVLFTKKSRQESAYFRVIWNFQINLIKNGL